MKLYRCPECYRFGVAVRLGGVKKDIHYYACRYCDWWAFIDGSHPEDASRRDRLNAVNTDWQKRGLVKL